MLVEVRGYASELNQTFFFPVTLWDFTQVSGIPVSRSKMKTLARMTKDVTSVSQLLD